MPHESIDAKLNRNEANSFLSRKVLANSLGTFEESRQGVLERECIEEICSYQEASEVFGDDKTSLVSHLNLFLICFQFITSTNAYLVVTMLYLLFICFQGLLVVQVMCKI